MRAFVVGLLCCLCFPAVADEGGDAFALEVQAKLGEGNLVWSPLSVTTALSMTGEGARGDTLKAIEKVLHLGAGEHRAVPRLPGLVEATGMWVQKKYPLRDTFVRGVKQRYAARVESADFVKEAQGARKTINDWVAEHTLKKITDLLPVDALDAATRLVLVDALYFKGKWEHGFEAKRTTPAAFAAPGAAVQAPFMVMSAVVGYAQGDGAQLVALPYKDSTLEMVVILPDKADGLPALEKGLTPARLAGWVAALERQEVTIGLPRFKLAGGAKLKNPLAALGMAVAFGEAADFRGMTTDPEGLEIAEVFHRATIEVDEEGTVATGATAVVMQTEAVHRITTFRADHPFLFLIRDAKTGVIAFMGRVVDPTR